jgi:hypothetical protein
MRPSRVVMFVIGVIVVIGLLPILGVFWLCRTTTTVEVIAIDEGYEIRITSAGRSHLPLGPEGPFHEWHQETRWLALGSGDREEIGGRTYKMYTFGRNLETSWLAKMFSTCTIYISEEHQRLIVQGALASDKQYLINHSGTYDGITIERPTILPLSAETAIHDVNRCYIRARGHLKDGQFDTEGKVFSATVWFEGEAELIGRVYERPGYPPLLSVSGYKRIAAGK